LDKGVTALFTFQPFSRKQRQIFSWWTDGSPVRDANGIIADGAIRSGKTLCMALSFVMWAMTRFNGQSFAMCGKTIGSFRRNVLAVLKQTLPGRGYQFTDKRADNLLVISRGEVTNYFYLFGGKDERSQDLIQGITLAGVLLDEVALMPESFVNQATSRCSVAGSKFWFNCNPAGAAHWFKTGWIDRREQRNLLRLRFTMADNLSLSPEVRARYAAQYTGAFYDRYIRGLWVTANGVIYDCFSQRANVPATLPETGGDYFVSCDYGTLNPTCFLLWQRERGGERWCCLREYYFSGREAQRSGHGRQKTDGELADDLQRWLAGIRPRSIVVDPSAASFMAELRQRGIPVQAADNRVLDGIRNVSELLRDGKLLFSKSCVRTLSEFGEYVWDEKASAQGIDKPVKEHDHAMDAVRYFVTTVVIRGQVRVSVRPRRL
jgi:PBSX family phage terminase large subunit